MYPQSAYRKGGVFNLRLNTPVAKATSLFRKRNSEPLTAPSAEGAFGGMPPRKASPERGGARLRRAEGFVPLRSTVAAALSAAVTATPKQENALNSHGRTSSEESSSLFPATLRERGSGGEALLLEKQPLPQRLPLRLLGREREGGGFSSEKSPPSQNHPQSLSIIFVAM